MKVNGGYIVQSKSSSEFVTGKLDLVHEPEAALHNVQDAFQDAEGLRVLLQRNRQCTEREVQLRVPFAVIIEALNQLDVSELRLLAQRLEERLAAVQH